jgi:hypothetical protein
MCHTQSLRDYATTWTQLSAAFTSSSIRRFSSTPGLERARFWKYFDLNNHCFIVIRRRFTVLDR